MARLFSYTDTHRHRLGPNYLQLPVNCPYKARLFSYTDTHRHRLGPNYLQLPVNCPYKARLFSYTDTHRHRLGPNYLQLPVNCPYKVTLNNNLRDGPMCFGNNQAGAPNYFPNSFNGQKESPRGGYLKFSATGDVAKYNSADDDNFSQATLFWKKTLNEEERNRLVNNIVGNLKAASSFIQDRAVKNFSQVDLDLGQRLAEGLRKITISKL
ncbi:hypothetical protein J6590_039820 [Homalodisca vitripennis]|nr:hypothetical protein J6590_039820 [Homalodisca vitripennis]